MATIIFVSSWPAAPTKGSPVRSSSAPGASPTKTSGASGLPTPKTMLVRLSLSLQRWQSPRSARICCKPSLETGRDGDGDGDCDGDGAAVAAAATGRATLGG